MTIRPLEEPTRTDRPEVVEDPPRASRLRGGVQRVTRAVRPLPPDQRRQASPLRSSYTWAAGLLGLLAVWFLTYGFVLSGLQEARSQNVLYDELRSTLSQATTPFGGMIAQGTPLMLIEGAPGGLDGQVVVEGTSSRTLMAGPGHLASTAMPGQEGTSVLLGRSVLYGGPFRDIDRFKAGDHIRITTGQGQFTYVVDRLRHPGDPLPTPPAAGTSHLVLVTSTAGGWRAGWAPEQTAYVDATMRPGKDAASRLQPAPGGRPSFVTAEQRVMHGDSSALLPLVLWLQLFAGVVVLLGWARSRWGSWQAWLVGMPLAVAALWGTTQAVVTLLPNLL